MINYNGNFNHKFSTEFNNRGFLFGDSVFETIKVVNNKIIFWEEHYLRLMSSMRILRIEIPNSYTPEFLENEIKKTNLKTNSLFSGRVRLTIFRAGSGLYLPESNEPVFLMIFIPFIMMYFLSISIPSFNLRNWKQKKLYISNILFL